MGLPEAVDFARNFAVMVRVRGLDPKRVKMRKHAFHQYHSGETTISASGMLLPNTLFDSEVAGQLCSNTNGNCPLLVVTVASIFEPFLTLKLRESIPQGRPELISSAKIDVMLERSDGDAPLWHAAQLLSLIDIPLSALSLQSLIEASMSSAEIGWEVGWSLASNSHAPKPVTDTMHTQGPVFNIVGESDSVSVMSKSITNIAILGMSLSFCKDILDIPISSVNRRGSFLLAVGSPFGVLSPVHFFNSISVGSISNCHPPNSTDRSLLIADMRILPGMEGSPVFSLHAHLIGILVRPLRQKMSGAEIQLVIPWEALATASNHLLMKRPQNAEKRMFQEKVDSDTVEEQSLSRNSQFDGTFSDKHGHSTSCLSSLSPVEKAMTSVCLVTIDGAWASGVLLNDQGLILTNAHLLEPWRFGKTHVTAERFGIKSQERSIPYGGPASFGHNGVEGSQKSQILIPDSLTVDPFAADHYRSCKFSSNYNRNACVRLDHVDPWVWCDAKVVYVCKGPWDVALLQLDSVPDHFSPIVTNFAWPSVGTRAYVIGHGLFGPRCGLFSSVSAGVVAKVVKVKSSSSNQSVQIRTNEHCPVMLETTAAVHPGASGGAVVNSDGHMIGLVTSNARHGGGTVIPHLNFSIPCEALAPIYKFSEDMRDISLLSVLDEPDEHLSSVWALMPTFSPKPPPLPNPSQALQDDKNKESKGSRFAKFIAEREEALKGQSKLGKLGMLPDRIGHSKL